MLNKHKFNKSLLEIVKAFIWLVASIATLAACLFIASELFMPLWKCVGPELQLQCIWVAFIGISIILNGVFRGR